MYTTKETLQQYTDGLITESEMIHQLNMVQESKAKSDRVALEKKQANYKQKWCEHVNEMLHINWMFKFDSEETKELCKHITAIKLLVGKASKNVKLNKETNRY